SGWVSTLLQILVLVGVIYFLRYGWRQAPAELYVRTRSLLRFLWGWLRARETTSGVYQARPQPVRVVTTKEFGDLNISSFLSLIMLIGLFCASQLLRGGCHPSCLAMSATDPGCKRRHSSRASGARTFDTTSDHECT